MQTQAFKRGLCVKLASLLEYPRCALTESVEQIGLVEGNAVKYLKDFQLVMGRMTLAETQEYYVKTFDLMPRCCLYVSVHLFGEESFKRSALMVGLKQVYDRHGVSDMTELPDHLAVLLKHNLLFEETEWLDLVSLAVLPALSKMIVILEKADNPYVHVLRAAEELLTQKELTHV